SQSGLKLSEAYADLDAELRYSVPGVRVADPKACQCGEVLKGVIKPWECKVFGTACTPERPIGTCMVSSEGACAAYYNFGRFAGGSIGDLAVNGTVNDLAVAGAQPLALTLSLVLEEGLTAADLRAEVEAIAAAATAAGVEIVGGDTKVVERGHADGMYVCTSG